jgi:hypothetical protein
MNFIASRFAYTAMDNQWFKMLYYWTFSNLITSGLTASVTGRQGMLTTPRHLTPPPVFPGVCVSTFVYLTCNSYLNFETDYSSVSWPFHLSARRSTIISVQLMQMGDKNMSWFPTTVRCYVNTFWMIQHKLICARIVAGRLRSFVDIMTSLWGTTVITF